MARDYYDVLGVSRTASDEELQEAYRRLARRYHPDVNKAPDAEDRFKEINEAYHALADPESRRRYDAGVTGVPGGAGGRRTAGGPYPGGPSPFGGAQWSTFDEAGIDLDELLGGVFGGRVGARGRGRGADLEAELELTVEEAYQGGRRQLSLDGRSLDVTIPAGVVDGQRIRLAGQGEAGGDLYLVVRIAPHPRYRLDGRDIYVDLPVAPWEAALGAKIRIETPGGHVEVRVPPGSSSGRKLRLRGRGMPHPRGRPGDLYAEVKIMVPPRLSPRERELFEELAKVSDFEPRSGR